VQEVWTRPSREYLRQHRGALPAILKRYPVETIISVAEDGNALDPSYQELDADNGLLWRLDGEGFRTWWRHITTLTVQYTGGYVLPANVPLRLQTAALTMIKHRWGTRERDPSLRQVSIPGVIERQYWVGGPGVGDIPPEVAGVLDSIADARA